MANLGEDDNRLNAKFKTTDSSEDLFLGRGEKRKSTKSGNSSQIAYSLSVYEKQTGKVDDQMIIIYSAYTVIARMSYLRTRMSCLITRYYLRYRCSYIHFTHNYTEVQRG